MDRSNNTVRLRGDVTEPPRFSHMGRLGPYYTFPLSVERLSGTRDVLNVVCTQADAQIVSPGDRLLVEGEVRTYNNRSGTGSRLVITVLARQLNPSDGEYENIVELYGALCKPPVYRTTPMGREICDVMLAVNRRYGRSDYLPCIVWGLAAVRAAEWRVGDAVRLTGRLQSRRYVKVVEGEPTERVAFEVSAVTAELVEKE